MKGAKLGEMVLTWLLPGLRKRRGMLRMKFLGFDGCFYWPRLDWGWGLHLMFWGYGFDCDSRPLSFNTIHDEYWYWLSEDRAKRSEGER